MQKNRKTSSGILCINLALSIIIVLFLKLSIHNSKGCPIMFLNIYFSLHVSSLLLIKNMHFCNKKSQIISLMMCMKMVSNGLEKIEKIKRKEKPFLMQVQNNIKQNQWVVMLFLIYQNLYMQLFLSQWVFHHVSGIYMHLTCF